MDDETAIDALRALELFADFSDEHLRLLAFVCQEQNLASGETLCEAGSAPGGAHVLAAGRLEAVLPDNDRERYRIDPPAIIGEIGLMLNRPRATTVVALRPSAVLFVPRDPFMKLLRNHPELAESVAATLRAGLVRYLDPLSALGERF